MNLQEHRALRAIEKNLTDEDPELAAFLRPSDRAPRRWMRRFVAALAAPMTLLGLLLGCGMLTAAYATLAWTVLGDKATR